MKKNKKERLAVPSLNLPRHPRPVLGRIYYLRYTAINHQTAVYYAKSANLLAQRNRLICYLPKKCAVDCTINDM